jgi:hypothetical protein
MDLFSLLFIILLCASVFALSMILDHLVSHTFRGRISRALVRGPGVITHELCHVIACLVTGAKIHEVTWYNPYDGSGKVVHGNPGIPVFGNFIIALAPFFGVSLLLLVLGSLFTAYAGITVAVPSQISPSVAGLTGVFASSVNVLAANLVYRQNILFPVYIYLNICLLTGLAPSSADIVNRDVVISILIMFAGIYAVMQYHIPVAAAVHDAVAIPFALVMGFGLICEVIALIVLLPIVLLIRRFR